MRFDFKALRLDPDSMDELRQKESGRRPFLLAALAVAFAVLAALGMFAFIVFDVLMGAEVP